MTYEIRDGDCLEVMAGMPDCSIDAIICDPPYGTTACKWDAVIPFTPMWEQLRRLLRPGGAVVFTAMQPFTSALIMSNPTWFRQTLVWDKGQTTDFQLANVRPMRRHEDIVIFCERSTVYNPQMTLREKPYDERNRPPTHSGDLMRIRSDVDTRRILRTHRYPTSVIEISSGIAECNSANRVHPTQKPVLLLEWLIRTYTNEGDTVLDFCAGSGSTGVACVNTARHFIGIERESTYVAIARRRLAQAAQQPALIGSEAAR